MPGTIVAMSVSTSSSISWSLVVPVKRLVGAKSRLRAFSASTRAELALAFAADTISAALACPVVDAVIVVTDEPAATRQLGELGAMVVPDRPDAGLNPALRYGADAALAVRPGCGVGALAADLPALGPVDLRTALTAAAAWPTAFVTDAAGSGTTLLASRDPAAFAPSFGAGSAARHRAAGAIELDNDVPTLRRDVDTEADLRAAVAQGVGLRTAAVARRLRLVPRLG